LCRDFNKGKCKLEEKECKYVHLLYSDYEKQKGQPHPDAELFYQQQQQSDGNTETTTTTTTSTSPPQQQEVEEDQEQKNLMDEVQEVHEAEVVDANSIPEVVPSFDIHEQPANDAW